MKNKTSLLIKLLVVGGLFFFLFQKGFISVRETGHALTQWQYMGPVVAVYLLNMFLGVFRWQSLLKAQNIHLPFGKTSQLTFVGNFFNIALPGAVSGDFVKAFYVGKEVPGLRARAFGSILFDRVAGLSALVVVSATALFLSYLKSGGVELFAPVQFSIYMAAVGVAAFYAYLFLVRESHDPVLILLKKLTFRFPKAESLMRIYEGLRHYHNHRWTVVQVLAISVLIHLLVGWTVDQFTLAMGVAGIALLPIYVIVPLGLLVTALPVLPAGLGTGHAAFLYLFHLLGTERGADIFTLCALMNLLMGAIGGVVYLQFRSHTAKPEFEPLAQ